jgi:phytoene dehydrogenase-like protein
MAAHASRGTLIIIGAGVAGLATACYGRRNGYDTVVFEMHDKPGGMCTSWRRGDYVFDYCIHNLAGTGKGSGLRGVWDELGTLNGVDVIDRDEFVCIEGPSGERLHWYTDLDRLEAHLEESAPEDRAAIADLVGAARRLAGGDLFAAQLGGIRRMLRASTRLPALNRWSGVTLGQFADRLHDPFLRRALVHAQYDIPGEEVPLTALLLFMAGMSDGDLGWPVGGSLAFSARVEQSVRDLDGEIRYRSRVEKILVEHDRAVGVRLADGTEHRADRVISAADGFSTIFRMLDGRYVTEAIERYYAGAGDVGPFGFVVFLGVRGTMEGEPHALTLLLDEPIDLGGVRQDSVHLTVFGPESGLAPEGSSIVKIETQARYSYWKELRDRDLAVYRRRTEDLADALVERLGPRFPDLASRVETMDVCTPPTAERFTGNRFGWQAGPPREDAKRIQREGLSKTLPGLDRFHHVGQWSTATLGVSSAAVMARALVKELCKQDGRRFVAA